MYYRESDTVIILHWGIQIPLVGSEDLLTVGYHVKSENYASSHSEVFYNVLCSPDNVTYLVTYLLTYLLHGAQSFLRSQPVFS